MKSFLHIFFHFLLPLLAADEAALFCAAVLRIQPAPYMDFWQMRLTGSAEKKGLWEGGANELPIA